TTAAVQAIFQQRPEFRGVAPIQAFRNDLDLLGDYDPATGQGNPVQYRSLGNGDTMLTRHLRWSDEEEWRGELGTLRGHGWFRMLVFQGDPDDPERTAMLSEGEGFLGNKTLSAWQFRRPLVLSRRVDSPDLA